VRMPEYRWGIFLAEPEPGRRIAFGDYKGQPAWQDVPGEHRGTLRRLIVTQGDTEPASVEQQRHLGRTCPSLYDLRNLFQVNVEEGRHLWAMVYLLQAHFGRVVQRACEIMRDHKTDDVRKHGGIDLPTLQRYLNFHYSVSLDLFGSEVSTNAANFYTAGLKGRFEETKKDDDHQLKNATYRVAMLQGERIVEKDEPALPSLNERVRDDYIADCQRGVDRWNRIIREHGLDVELRLPHRAFHRAIGAFSEVRVSPDGRVLTQAEWEAKKHEWLPTEDDQAWVESLMRPETEPGKFASWIAPPPRGVNGQPLDFEYVRLV